MKVEFYETEIEKVKQEEMFDKGALNVLTRKFIGGPLTLKTKEQARKIAEVLALQVHEDNNVTVAMQSEKDKDVWKDVFSTTGLSSEVPGSAEGSAKTPTKAELKKAKTVIDLNREAALHQQQQQGHASPSSEKEN